MRRKSNPYSCDPFKWVWGIFFIFTLLGACTRSLECKKEKLAHDFDWLVGTWEQKSGDKSTFENWSKKSDSELLGQSYTVQKGDTQVQEKIRIFWQDSHWLYQPQVFNQNEGKPVDFVCTFVSDSGFTAENPGHVPHLIDYTYIRPDSLIAEVFYKSGDQGGSLLFEMRRVKKDP